MLGGPIVLDTKESTSIILAIDIPWAVLSLCDTFIIFVNFQVEVVSSIFTSLKGPCFWMILSSAHVTSIDVVRWHEPVLLQINLKPRRIFKHIWTKPFFKYHICV